MSIEEYDLYSTIKGSIKANGDYSRPLESLPIYKAFYEDLLSRFAYEAPSQSSSASKRISISETLYASFKKVESAANLDACISFFLLISQKMTDRNRKATRFGSNMKYSSSYNAGCRLYEQMKSGDLPSDFLSFCREFKNNVAKPAYVHLIETDQNDEWSFTKTVYDIALSAAIFTQIEDMQNNVKRNRSSGRLMIKPPASQLSSQEPQYNPLDGMSKQNLLFVKMCLQLCQTLIKSNDLKQDAKAYSTMLLPLYIDKISGTALVLAGEKSLPHDYEHSQVSSLYLAVLSFYRNEQRINNRLLQKACLSSYSVLSNRPQKKGRTTSYSFHIEEIDDSISTVEPDAAESDQVYNDDALSAFEEFFVEYNCDVECDRALIQQQNGHFPQNCHDYFSAYFTNARYKDRYKDADKETLRLEKKKDEMAREY